MPWESSFPANARSARCGRGGRVCLGYVRLRLDERCISHNRRVRCHMNTINPRIRRVAARGAAVAWLCLSWTAVGFAADNSPAAAGADAAGAGAASAETSTPEQASATSAAPSARQLSIHQGAVADRYKKLEKLLEDMARIEAVGDPRRAALLMKALEQSKENLTGVKLDRCVQSLERLDAQNKTEREGVLDLQREAQQDMKRLLELLLSENRTDRLKNEQDRIREYIKEVERILRLQKGVQGRTEGGGDPHELARDQGKIGERTGELAKQIRDNEEGDDTQRPASESGPPPSDQDGEQSKPDASPQAEGQPKDGAPNDAQGADKPQGKQVSDGKQQPGDADAQRPADKPPGGSERDNADDGSDAAKPAGGQPKQGQNQADGKPSDGQPSDRQPSDRQPSEGGQSGDASPADADPQSQDPQRTSEAEGNPARRRVEAARQRMDEARKKLDEAQRNDAIAEQEKAKEELEKAKAELERILRQMREEEVERMLALLESRFRKMLEIQMRIYEETVRLGKIPEDERELKAPIPAGKLAVDQRKLVVEADKALNLLLEEGSSVAFPETVTQMRDDMQQVADRLDVAKVERITQDIEQDIIAALQELIEALQKAQRDHEQNKQQPQQAQPGQPQDMPLVDAIAELKMIRALQMRVNTRTQRYARLLDNMDDPVGQATDRDLREALSKLAERQQTIYRLTRDIVVGKNK